MWRNGSKKIIYNFEDNLLNSLTRNNLQKKIIVGSDSQILQNKVSFVTTVIIWTVGHGAVFFYKKENVDFHKKYELIQNRLFEQTYRAVQIANCINELLKQTNYRVEQIHCDINGNKKFKSNRAVPMCVGYIVSNGFKPVIKPYAYGASCVADSLTR